MTLLSMNTRSKELLHSMRPLLFGVPTFLIIFTVLIWSLARLASWIFALLKVSK